MCADHTPAFLLDETVQLFIAQAQRRRYQPKETIIQDGDTPESLFMIIDGSVSILRSDEDGREMVLAYLNPGDIFGEMCLFPELKARSALVRARTETWVAEMSYSEFREMAHREPDIMFILAGQLSVRLRDTSRRLTDLAFLDVAGRMARVLLQLKDEPDAQTVEDGKLIKTSRQELARIIGCSREMAGRVLKTLEDEGLVRTQGRSIIVLKKAPLPRGS